MDRRYGLICPLDLLHWAGSNQPKTNQDQGEYCLVRPGGTTIVIHASQDDPKDRSEWQFGSSNRMWRNREGTFCIACDPHCPGGEEELLEDEAAKVVVFDHTRRVVGPHFV